LFLLTSVTCWKKKITCNDFFYHCKHTKLWDCFVIPQIVWDGNLFPFRHCEGCPAICRTATTYNFA